MLPSDQEGLCISALGVMSCGVSIVSTRCGGSEGFDVPEQTGILVDFNVKQMAHAIQTIVTDRELRNQLALAARTLIEEKYTIEVAETRFMEASNSTFL